jgi:hypothetical protein
VTAFDLPRFAVERLLKMEARINFDAHYQPGARGSYSRRFSAEAQAARDAARRENFDNRAGKAFVVVPAEPS